MSEFKVGSGSPVYQTEAKTKANPATKLTPAVNTTTNEPVANRTSAYSGRSGGAVSTHNASANTQVFGTPTPKAATPSAAQLIASLPKNQESPAFYTAVSKMLSDPAKRSTLINHFQLNSPANKEALKVATFMEGGSTNKANAMLTGEIIMNRALAIGLVEGKVSIRDVVKKPNQFEINNPKVMHKAGLKTFDEVIADKNCPQYKNAMSSLVDDVSTSLIAGKRSEKGAVHYGFKGNGVRNIPDTPRIDRGTIRSW